MSDPRIKVNSSYRSPAVQSILAGPQLHPDLRKAAAAAGRASNHAMPAIIPGPGVTIQAPKVSGQTKVEVHHDPMKCGTWVSGSAPDGQGGKTGARVFVTDEQLRGAANASRAIAKAVHRVSHHLQRAMRAHTTVLELMFLLEDAVEDRHERVGWFIGMDPEAIRTVKAWRPTPTPQSYKAIEFVVEPVDENMPDLEFELAWHELRRMDGEELECLRGLLVPEKASQEAVDAAIEHLAEQSGVPAEYLARSPNSAAALRKSLSKPR